MAGDFGDESGEKLFDWMLKMGQDASETALLAGAERLQTAFRNARGEIAHPTDMERAPERPTWAKLRLAEFEELPEFETIKEAIDLRLMPQELEHDFFKDVDNHEFLLFRIQDAPAVAEVRSK